MAFDCLGQSASMTLASIENIVRAFRAVDIRADLIAGFIKPLGEVSALVARRAINKVAYDYTVAGWLAVSRKKRRSSSCEKSGRRVARDGRRSPRAHKRLMVMGCTPSCAAASSRV